MTTTSLQRHPAVNGPWAVRLSASNAAAAAAIRRWPAVYARTEANGEVWLRGRDLTEALDLELRKLPGAERFTLASDDQSTWITPLGKRIPAGTLPDDDWHPIAEWCRTTLPTSALPAVVPGRVPLTLVRSDVPAEPGVLVATLDDWLAWAVDAPLVRLRCLSFAASSDGRVVVRGSPLPPIPGVQYVERQGVAVPAGYVLRPAVDPATIHAVLMTCETDLAVFATDGTWDRIDAGQFVAASRAAARATVKVDGA